MFLQLDVFLDIQRWKMFSVNGHIYGAWKDFKDWLGGQWQRKGISTHTLWHLHTLSFLKGERSVSRGRNGEPLLWLIARQGPGRTLCHFHRHTHYTREEDSLPHPLLTCPLERQSPNRNVFSEKGGDERYACWRRETNRNMLNTHTSLRCY